MSVRNKAVVLVSGGMDSLVTAAIANLNYSLAFLHVNYGQKTEKRELKAFNDIADYYGVAERMVIDLRYLSQIGGSSLTDRSMVITPHDPGRHTIPLTYVPFRNANILSVAVSWAEVLGASQIYIGAVEEDSSGYPDCREVFYEAFNKVIEYGTRPETKIQVVTPLIHLNKSEIVKKGAELNAPFELSWSCYKSEELACGECDSCVLRLRGFKTAGIEDPIKYRTLPQFIS